MPMTGSRRLILFTRFPTPGRVKTRLIPALGAAGAAALHRRLVLRSLRTGHAACSALDCPLEIHFDGTDENAMHHWVGDGVRCLPQAGGDLGNRLACAFDESFRAGSASTVLIGSDCPGLTSEILARAFESLEHNPVVLGPAQDGGYYLVGLTHAIPELFRDVPWGSASVLAESLAKLGRLDLKAKLLEELEDIDRPADLERWGQVIELEKQEPDRISVIVPALNEAAGIFATLQSAQAARPHEIIVVDGGSTDDTARLAVDGGASVLTSRPGRARQMNAGAAMASGNTFLFLHADTRLPPNWVSLVTGALADQQVAAGAFGFEPGSKFVGAKIIQVAANLRSRWFQMPYGDQALFLRRSTFEEEGGFANLPIMEDVELVRRLRRRGRIVTLFETAVTSARRWERQGAFRVTLHNQLMLVGYYGGIRPQKLQKWGLRHSS